MIERRITIITDIISIKITSIVTITSSICIIYDLVMVLLLKHP